MKRILFIMTLAIIALANSSDLYAQNSGSTGTSTGNKDKDLPTSYEILAGTGGLKPYSLDAVDPTTLFSCGNDGMGHVVIIAHATLPSVRITFCDMYGQVVSGTTMNFTEDQWYSIYAADWTDGHYRICLELQDGTFLHAFFDIPLL